MSSGSNPLLFGRVTALTTDHESLSEVLHQLEELCANQATGRADGEPPLSEERLSRWRNELARHFEAEESDAYFGVIRADRPSLAPTISRFEDTHVRLLALSDEVLALYQTRRWLDLARTAARLSALFRQHEHQESMLMREFLVPPDG